jgi:hypothetical protein
MSLRAKLVTRGTNTNGVLDVARRSGRYGELIQNDAAIYASAREPAAGHCS